MAEAAGLVHYSFFVTAFQVATAAFVIQARTASRELRIWAVLLIVANAIVSCATMLSLIDPARAAIYNVASFVADAPTPEILVLFALAATSGGWTVRARRLTRGLLILIGAIAMLFAPIPGIYETIAEEIFVAAPVFLGYSAAILLLAREVFARASWVATWLLGAFLLRGADFAARHPGVLSTPWSILPYVLLVAVIVALVLIVRSALPREQRVVLMLTILVGATLGAVGRWGSSGLAQYHESLLTLTVGRPALILLALAPSGLVRPFFRGCVAALAGYAGGVGAVRATGILSGGAGYEIAFGAAVGIALPGAIWAYGRGGGDRAPRGLDPLPGGTDHERLLHLLAARSGPALTRREIAEALGILPQNVQRVVDAANRSKWAVVGTDLVQVSFLRGRNNQLQYAYALTESGKAAAKRLSD